MIPEKRPESRVTRGQTLGQGRKTNPGTRSRKPGTDGTASEFPAKGPGNTWQSRQYPEGTVAGGAVFHEVSRAERPSQQTANFRQLRRKSVSAPGPRVCGVAPVVESETDWKQQFSLPNGRNHV